MVTAIDVSILQKSTQTLLNEPLNFGQIYADLHSLHALYASVTGVSAGSITDKDIDLPSGNAVSTIKAAHCLLEIQRTAVFIRGIHKAILELKKRFSGQRLNILYAGCGPYATLLTPFTTVFGADEVAFYMLDVNSASIHAAKKMYQALQLDDYVAEWIVTDATTYKVPADLTMHLMVSETMLNALRKEPQVAIMLNLVPQLHPQGLFVPQQIAVTAQLLSGAREQNRYQHPDTEPERINLGVVYTIGRDNCNPQQPVAITIPANVYDFKELRLLTDITTFADERLGIYDSSLNLPLRVAYVDGFEGRKVTFTYQMGEKPGWDFVWEPENSSAPANAIYEM